MTFQKGYKCITEAIFNTRWVEKGVVVSSHCLAALESAPLDFTMTGVSCMHLLLGPTVC